MSDAAEPRGGPLSERLDHLFRTVVKPDGSPYSHREAGEAISRDHEPISHAYIGQLRSGERDNPTIKHLRGLAAFFGVPVEYFTRDDIVEQVDKELQLISTLRDLRDNQAMRTLIVRTRGLSPKSLQSLSDIADRIREIEGLPPDQGER
jgi:ESX-1-secreted protein regulator